MLSENCLGISKIDKKLFGAKWIFVPIGRILDVKCLKCPN